MEVKKLAYTLYTLLNLKNLAITYSQKVKSLTEGPSSEATEQIKPCDTWTVFVHTSHVTFLDYHMLHTQVIRVISPDSEYAPHLVRLHGVASSIDSTISGNRTENLRLPVRAVYGLTTGVACQFFKL